MVFVLEKEVRLRTNLLFHAGGSVVLQSVVVRAVTLTLLP